VQIGQSHLPFNRRTRHTTEQHYKFAASERPNRLGKVSSQKWTRPGYERKCIPVNIKLF